MNKLNALTRGVVVFAILAVVTVVEFILARAEVSYVVLALLALVKAGLVLWYFMHLPRVFNSDGGHE